MTIGVGAAGKVVAETGKPDVESGIIAIKDAAELGKVSANSHENTAAHCSILFFLIIINIESI